MALTATQARPEIRFAHAILIAGGCYVLQLRDNKPGIAAPGMWALFGGCVEKGEPTDTAVRREIDEELCLALDDYREFWVVNRYCSFVDAVAEYSFFTADITARWGQHRLMEGQAIERFEPDALAGLPMFDIMREALQRHQATIRSR